MEIRALNKPAEELALQELERVIAEADGLSAAYRLNVSMSGERLLDKVSGAVLMTPGGSDFAKYWRASSRPYQSHFFQVTIRFAAFFKMLIYKMFCNVPKSNGLFLSLSLQMCLLFVVS